MEIQWPLALFTLLTAMGGCMFGFVALNEFTHKSKVSGLMPGIVAGIIVIVGGICSVFHLAHVERIMNALSHPTSGIFIEIALVAATVVCIAVYLILLWRKIDGGVKVFAVLGAIAGLALSFMAGHSYMMEAVSAWNSYLLPIGYLMTGLPMGATLYWALCCKDQDSGKFMAICTLVCGILALLSVGAYAIFAGAFAGAATLWVVLGALILAGVVPIVTGALGIKSPGTTIAWVTFVCVTIGACLYRILMWIDYNGVFGFFGNM